MQQHRRKAHPTPRLIIPITILPLLTPYIAHLIPGRPAHPPAIQHPRQLRVIIPAPRSKVHFTILVIDAVVLLAPAPRRTAVGVEHQVRVPRGKLLRGVDGVRGVHGLEAVVKGDGRGPHFGLHGAALEVLLVHRFK